MEIYTYDEEELDESVIDNEDEEQEEISFYEEDLNEDDWLSGFDKVLSFDSGRLKTK